MAQYTSQPQSRLAARKTSQEDDSPTPSPVKAALSNTSMDADAHSQQISTHSSNKVHENDLAMTSDSDSDLEIRRPAGKAARRMLGGNQSPAPLTQHSSAAADTTDLASDEDELYSVTPLKFRKPYRDQTMSPPHSETRSALFVSPTKPAQADSDNELPTTSNASKSRLATLVAEKRAERLAREAEERSRHAMSDLPEEILQNSQEPVDEDIERIMSDSVKPTRKASRRAILEMERETQRMARNQALAHEMKVKKKFTTSDLFARFNYRPVGDLSVPAAPEGDSSASSAPTSDAAEVIGSEPVSTPPSSPPTPLDRQRALVEQGALSKLVPVRQDSLASLAEENDDDDDDQDLPDIAEILSSSRTSKRPDGQSSEVETAPKKRLKLARLGKKAMAPPHDSNSDDDLEIVQERPACRLSIFDKAKGTMQREHTDSTAIHVLKHLAHIGADSRHTGRKPKNGTRPSVNPQVLEAQLRMRAKDQARAQQLERIAELKAKGIDVQTSEEREREQEIFEDLLEKARQDAVELRRTEKAAAKGIGADTEGNAIASDDESEDDDYVEESESDGDAGDAEKREANDLVDDTADESDDDEVDFQDKLGDELDPAEDGLNADSAGKTEQAASQAEVDDTPDPSQFRTFSRKMRQSRVVKDDDDEESEMEDSQQLPHAEDHVDDVEDDDPFAAFGFNAAHPGSSLMSPTQAFNATMQSPTQFTQQDSLDVLRYLVPPSSSSLPPISPGMGHHTQSESQVDFVPGSQVPESQQINLAWETQAPETPITGMKRDNSELTLDTPGWQPTQDDGLPATFQVTPTMRREDTIQSMVDEETQSTVRLRVSESPVPTPAAKQNRKRLVRGQRVLADSSDEEDAAPLSTPKLAKKDAFREMARKRREALTAAELAEAEQEMKRMMDEQAEESEDEYAGLGGDDFVAPENEQDREMIDSSHVDVNERELAALYAERQRAADEAAASKLYKDLTTGALRRKQANAFDLDEDEDDLAVRRRQMRQREEARKRKLLLQDDNIAGLAEGKQSKGKDAFLKAIADDDDRDDDVLDLSDVDDEDGTPDTQTDSQPSQDMDSQAGPLKEISGNKRRLEEAPDDRPPAKQRRTKGSAFRAPTSLLEVKESVSFLLDDTPIAAIEPSVLEMSSDSEDDDQEMEQAEDDEAAIQEETNRQNDGGYIPDHVAMPPPRLPASQRRTPAKPAVVDRLSMKRSSSASESNRRTAWAAPANGGFKVPSLLRRATTNTAFATNERGVMTSNGMSRENSGVKKGGSSKSSLAYQARTEERKAIVEAGAKQRAQNTARIAQLRRAASSGFGKGLGGRFEG